MIEIKVMVKRRNAQAKPKTYLVNCPEHWNEMGRVQILAFAQYGLTKTKGEAKIALISAMTEIPPKVYQKMSVAQVAAITQCFNFLYDTNTLTENKLTTLAPKEGPVLHGPADSLNDLTWAEFIVCDKYFRAFTRSQNLDLLEYIIAVLYREKDPSKTRGNVRVPFDIHALSESREAVRSLSDPEKFAVLFFYIGCYNQMKSLYEFVFPEQSRIEGGAEIKTENEESDKDWFDFIRTLPNEKFGTLTEIQKANVHDTLYTINKMMEENLNKRQPTP